MSQPTLDKEIAPKRQRMLDMILALGGLKEESAIPLSRVTEELDNLKTELAPLTDAILAFPDSYYDKFLEAVNKSKLVNDIHDKGILKESISNIENALSKTESESLKNLDSLLSESLARMTMSQRTGETSVGTDMSSTLSTAATGLSD